MFSVFFCDARASYYVKIILIMFNKIFSVRYRQIDDTKLKNYCYFTFGLIQADPYFQTYMLYTGEPCGPPSPLFATLISQQEALTSIITKTNPSPATKSPDSASDKQRNKKKKKKSTKKDDRKTDAEVRFSFLRLRISSFICLSTKTFQFF